MFLRPRTAAELFNQLLKNQSTKHRLIHAQQNISIRDHRVAAVVISCLSAGAGFYLTKIYNERPVSVKYTLQEVRERGWSTYAGGVYDLKGYAESHPGGEDMIAQAAGGAIETFWDKYDFHYKMPEVLKQLETMRVGDLKEDKKPARCKSVTKVPKVDPENYKLELTVGGKTVKTLSLDDLKRYPRHSIVSAIPCKNDPAKQAEVTGRTWTGARLGDILRDSGINVDDYNKLQLECLDSSKIGIPYDSKVAVDPELDALLAYEVNGAELPPKQGYPIRVVIPETAGRKNVKWLSKIELVKNEQKVAANIVK